MAGIQKKKRIKEFEQAGIMMKTIRTMQNGKPKESMSFRYIRFEEMVDQTWEESDFYGDLDHELFSPVFGFTADPSKQSRKELKFRGAFFWTVPDEDFEVIKSVWEDTRQKVENDDFDHFIGMKDNPISHIRPHARNSLDVTDYYGRKVKKVSFWLKETYIEGIIDKHLK